MVKQEILYVNMNGIRVGELYRDQSGAMSFKYDRTWKNRSDARPISLSLSLSDRLYTGISVYNFFDNLLPDSDHIRARVQRRFHSPTTQPFDLLRSIGQDCVGAIQLTTDERLEDRKKISCVPLTDSDIASILKKHKRAPFGMMEEIDDFRISLAGAQEKTAFTFWNGNWCRPRGVTPTTHIFKRPIGIIEYSNIDLSESCENEWLCLQIVKAFGIPVAEATVKCFDDEKTLIVKRFDRRFSKDDDWIIRLPQEDMCQALGYSPHLKYENDGGPGIKPIMDLLLSSRNAESDRTLFMKSQIVFWLLAAIDGHAKNFSIFLEAGNRYSLTPLYDILSAYPYFSKRSISEQKAKMAMALRGKNVHFKWSSIIRRHFLSTAQSVGYSSALMENLLEEVSLQTDNVIRSVADSLPSDFPDYVAHPIFEGIIKTKRTVL